MGFFKSKKEMINEPTGDWLEIYNNLKDLYMSSFKWNNVPQSINTRYIELSLFDYGKVAFFKDDVLGMLALKANLASELNVYYEPTKVIAYGGNGYQKMLTNSTNNNDGDCVIVYNNKIRDIPAQRIRDFAIRINNCDKTIDLNIHQQKTPYVVKGSKKSQLSLQNFFNQHRSFKTEIFIDDSIDVNTITTVPTIAPYVADKIEEQKRKIWNEALSYIGIENNFSEKNERLTQGEVLVSNGLAIANRNSKLNARQEAVEKINTLFGSIIDVEINNLSVLDMNFDGGAEIE